MKKPSRKRIESATALIDEYLNLFDDFKEACKAKDAVEEKILLTLQKMTHPQRERAAKLLIKKVSRRTK